MKLCLLFLVLSVGVQGHFSGHDNSIQTIEDYIEAYHAFYDSFKDVFRNMLTEDKSDLQVLVKATLSLVESSVCEGEEASEECDPGTNWVLGCKCRNEFSLLGDSCSRIPCELVQYFKDDGPRIMRDFLAAENFEVMFRVAMEPAEKIWRMLCECRGVVDAMTNCVPQYDGQLFTVFNLDWTGFDRIVGHLDWELVNEAVQGYLDAVCGAPNGEDCLPVFNMWQVNYGTFLDNTSNKKNICLSYLRAEEELEAYLEAEVKKDNMTWKSYIEGAIEKYMVMEEKKICDAKCAPEMQETFFFSCCLKHAGELLSSEDMKEKLVKLFQNVWILLYTGDAPDLTDAVDRFMSMYRPAEFCGEHTDVFKKFNDQCDVLTA